jgi:hypothetical protein
MKNSLLFPYIYDRKGPEYKSLLEEFITREVRLVLSKKKLREIKNKYFASFKENYDIEVRVVEKKRFLFPSKYIVFFVKLDPLLSAKFNPEVLIGNMGTTA